MNSTILGLPINRFVTFVLPLINLAAGALAAWLAVEVELLGTLGISEDDLTQQITAGLVILVTTGVLELGRSQWIKGHHIELEDGAIAIREEEDELDWESVGSLPAEKPTTPDEGDAGVP